MAKRNLAVVLVGVGCVELGRLAMLGAGWMRALDHMRCGLRRCNATPVHLCRFEVPSEESLRVHQGQDRGQPARPARCSHMQRCRTIDG